MTNDIVEPKHRAVAQRSHTFSVEVLRQFRGHPFALVFETLRNKGFEVRARDGLLIPEPGVRLEIAADESSVTYMTVEVLRVSNGTDQLNDGV
jgi:hypothetical protein